MITQRFVQTRRQLAFGLGASALTQMPPRAQPVAAEAGAFARWLAELEAESGGRLGVAVLAAPGNVHGYRLDERFPLCSTYKALAASAILARIDRAQDRLDRRIRFPAVALVPYSPVTKQHAGSDGMTLAAICESALSLSDNTAANLMLDALGGPAALTAFLRSVGDGVTRIDRNEPTLNEAAAGDVRDTTSPRAMSQTLRRVVLGDVLATPSRARLTQWLLGCRTGDARLRAGVPPGWRVGDKTGTGDNATCNDVGILWPPEGVPLVVTVYMTDANRLNASQREEQIARIAGRTTQLFS